jgi:hypothetical protein
VEAEALEALRHDRGRQAQIDEMLSYGIHRAMPPRGAGERARAYGVCRGTDGRIRLQPRLDLSALRL